MTAIFHAGTRCKYGSRQGSVKVVIPFAKRLADLVPPVAIRLRRDFKTVLMLIRAHALLHQPPG
jgi:hypothetical protein